MQVGPGDGDVGAAAAEERLPIDGVGGQEEVGQGCHLAVHFCGLTLQRGDALGQAAQSGAVSLGQGGAAAGGEQQRSHHRRDGDTPLHLRSPRGLPPAALGLLVLRLCLPAAALGLFTAVLQCFHAFPQLLHVCLLSSVRGLGGRLPSAVPGGALLGLSSYAAPTFRSAAPGGSPALRCLIPASHPSQGSPAGPLVRRPRPSVRSRYEDGDSRPLFCKNYTKREQSINLFLD